MKPNAERAHDVYANGTSCEAMVSKKTASEVVMMVGGQLRGRTGEQRREIPPLTLFYRPTVLRAAKPASAS